MHVASGVALAILQCLCTLYTLDFVDDVVSSGLVSFMAQVTKVKCKL